MDDVVLLGGAVVGIEYDDFFFFFQAEDGIRDRLVTGVQTCALPILVIWRGYENIPILSDGRMCSGNVSECGYGALTTAILISAMVYVTMWFFMSGKKHTYFTEDPDKAKFYAGIIGLASLVIIALSWADYSREMIVSAILTSVSSWSYIRSSQMK